MEKFDLIVVGAGPAGLGAAYTAAKAGLKTIVFERGEYPGSKNVMGGVLYRQPTESVFPDFWRQAPLERPVVEQNYWFLSEDASVRIGYRSADFGKEPYNNFTVLRARFDRWLGQETEKAGALLITETLVEELLREEDRVVGVRTGRPDGELRAPLVILAEGVNSLLVQQLGLRDDIAPQHLAVSVKEIISLPSEKIEDRFGLAKGQGAVIELVGDPTGGILGTGFLYTNKESLSIGVGAILSDMVKRKWNPNDLLERLKQHPSIKPLLEGGEMQEYMAHLIPEGGFRAMPALSAPGVLVVGDAAMLVNGMVREGSNLAVVSGKLAAETAVEAHNSGDFSNRTLGRYRDRLQNSFVLQDLHKFRNTTAMFEENPQFFTDYPEMMTDLLHEFFLVDSVPKKDKFRLMFDRLRKRRSYGRLAGDLYKLWRAFN